MTVQLYKSVQALRLAACVAVVWYHACFWAGTRLDSPVPVPVELGDASVWLFFTISGFVMMHLHDSGHETDWRTFALRRVVRIVPLAWVMTTFKLMTIALTPSVIVDGAVTPGRILSSYFFVPLATPDGHVRMLWGVEWTLVFEMAFYLLLAIALACRVDPLVLATPVLLVLAVASIWRPEDGDLGWFYCSPVTLFFLAGMWLARCTRWSTTTRRSGMTSVVALLSVVFGAVTWANGDEGTLPRVLIFVGVTATVAVAVTFEPLVGRYVPQWALSGAAASYSLYLTHPVLAQLVPEALERLGLTQAPWPLVVVASVVVSLAAARPIHRHLEQPMNRAARRLLERRWHRLVGARTR